MVQPVSQPVTLRHKVSQSVTTVTLIERTTLTKKRPLSTVRLLSGRSLTDRDEATPNLRRLRFSYWTRGGLLVCSGVELEVVPEE